MLIIILIVSYGPGYDARDRQRNLKMEQAENCEISSSALNRKNCVSSPRRKEAKSSLVYLITQSKR